MFGTRLVAMLPAFMGITMGALAHAMVYDRQGRVLDITQASSDLVAWSKLASDASDAWTGIGAIARVEKGQPSEVKDLLAAEEALLCTGSLIETGVRGSAPAYVLTNGHCYGGREQLSPTQVIFRQHPSEEMYFLLNMRAGVSPEQIRRVKVKRIVYATMNGSDVGVLELDARLEELANAGYRPLLLSLAEAREGEAVSLVGVPMDEMRSEQRVLHRSDCVLGAHATTEQVRYELPENEEDWKPVVYHWPRSIRHACSMVGGNSGSPIISQRSGLIVAVNNGAVEEGCFPNCRELDDEGKPRLVVANTAQSIAALAPCFDKRGRFRLNAAGCMLIRPLPTR